jgi:hypothetical protein
MCPNSLLPESLFLPTVPFANAEGKLHTRTTEMKQTHLILPDKYPTDEWYNAEAVHELTNCSSIEMKTGGNQLHDVEDVDAEGLKHW